MLLIDAGSSVVTNIPLWGVVDDEEGCLCRGEGIYRKSPHPPLSFEPKPALQN